MTLTTPNTTTNYFISGIDNLRDPVRNTRWRLLIPDTIRSAVGIAATNGPQFNGNAIPGLDYSLHVKTAHVPEIQITEGAHYYMGFVSNYPVNAKLNGSMSFETILLEDIRAYEIMMGWNQACLNTGILAGDVNGTTQDRMSKTGIRLGLGALKDASWKPDYAILRNQTISVQMYNWLTGDPIMTVTLINAWPSKVSGFDLTYKNDAQLVSFNFELMYDRWSVFVHNYNPVRDGVKEQP